MTHKIFAYLDGKYWCGRNLLPYNQIKSILHTLNWKKEVFATIQTYDQFGNCISSPLYFDFDGDHEVVHNEVKAFVQSCIYILNVIPKVFFSGNKGFHVIIDYIIEHPQCHLLVKDFAKEMTCAKTLDQSVYRTLSMFRLPGSPASKPGYYKIPITRTELFTLSFEQIKELAKKQRIVDQEHDIEKIDQEAMSQWLKKAIENLPTYDDINHVLAHTDSVNMEITPCIKSLINDPQPKGTRNAVVFILARFFKLCGLDLTSAQTALLSTNHWKEYEANEHSVSKVFRSVYNSQDIQKLGCKNNSEGAGIMRSLCQDICPYSPNFPKLEVTDSHKVTCCV